MDVKEGKKHPKYKTIHLPVSPYPSGLRGRKCLSRTFSPLLCIWENKRQSGASLINIGLQVPIHKSWILVCEKGWKIQVVFPYKLSKFVTFRMTLHESLLILCGFGRTNLEWILQRCSIFCISDYRIIVLFPVQWEKKKSKSTHHICIWKLSQCIVYTISCLPNLEQGKIHHWDPLNWSGFCKFYYHNL